MQLPIKHFITYRPLKAVDREFDIGFFGFSRFPRNRLFWSILVGFRGSGGLPLDSQHPGDSFPQSFSPRSSISTLFDPFLMILDDSRMLRKPLGPSPGFRKPPVEHSGLMTEPVQGQASPGRGKVALCLGKTPVWNNLSNLSNLPDTPKVV